MKNRNQVAVTFEDGTSVDDPIVVAVDDEKTKQYVPSGPRRYLVKKTKLVSVGGLLDTIREGTVLDEVSYGAEGIAALKRSGVEIEELA